jgi:hypothetical protein
LASSPHLLVTVVCIAGHGLSYTSFKYSGLSVRGRNISFYLTNSGASEKTFLAPLCMIVDEGSTSDNSEKDAKLAQ